MKFISIAFVLFFLITVVFSAPGEYVPKGFYTIDENGNQSPMAFISGDNVEQNHHRQKRSPAFVSSSSSSSSSSFSNGGPVFFQQTGSVYHSAGVGARPKALFKSTSGYVDKYGRVYYRRRSGSH